MLIERKIYQSNNLTSFMGVAFLVLRSSIKCTTWIINQRNILSLELDAGLWEHNFAETTIWSELTTCGGGGTIYGLCKHRPDHADHAFTHCSLSVAILVSKLSHTRSGANQTPWFSLRAYHTSFQASHSRILRVRAARYLFGRKPLDLNMVLTNITKIVTSNPRI